MVTLLKGTLKQTPADIKVGWASVALGKLSMIALSLIKESTYY